MAVMWERCYCIAGIRSPALLIAVAGGMSLRQGWLRVLASLPQVARSAMMVRDSGIGTATRG
jgi:hypothetical protein